MAEQEKNIKDSVLLMAMWKALNCPLEDDIDAKKVISQYAEFRDAQEIDELHEQFLCDFGKESDKTVVRPAQAIAFNGGGSSDQHPEHYYPGMHFSIPLVSYTMRLALKEGREESYDKYIQGVDRIAKKTGVDVDEYPSKERLEKLTEPYLKKLSSISLENEGLIAQQPDEEFDFHEHTPS